MIQTEDLFETKSKTWDKTSGSAQTAQAIADSIVKNINLNPSMEVMDFGAGTGLLGYFISAHVKKIVAIDNSPAMLLQLRDKSFHSEIEVIEKDLSLESLQRTFDGIISSMTLHHIEDLEDIFTKFYKMLTKDGFIAIADLECEDGTFHSDNTGVFHYGFDSEILKNIAKNVGFRNVYFKSVHTISKKKGRYTVFLMIAVK